MKNKYFSCLLLLVNLINFILKTNLFFSSLTLIINIVLVYLTYSKKNNLFVLLLLVGLNLIMTNSTFVYFSSLIYSIYLIYNIGKNRFKDCLKDNPLYSSLLLVIYGFGIGLCGNYLFKIVDEFVFGKEFICESLSLISVIILSIVMGKKSIYFKNYLNLFKSLLTGGVIFITSIIVLISQIFYGLNNYKNIASAKNIILICLLYLTLGFFEEILIRGIVLDTLLNKYDKTKKGIFSSILISSFVFGIIHFINLSFGLNIYAVIVQVIFCFIFGIYLGALYARTRNIYACSIIHGLWDLSTAICLIFNLSIDDVNKVSSINIGILIIYIPIIFFGLFMLRKNKIEEIILLSNNKKCVNQKENILIFIGRILLLIFITIFCFIIGSRIKLVIG